jgi:hypothetical protein
MIGNRYSIEAFELTPIGKYGLMAHFVFEALNLCRGVGIFPDIPRLRLT